MKLSEKQAKLREHIKGMEELRAKIDDGTITADESSRFDSMATESRNLQADINKDIERINAAEEAKRYAQTLVNEPGDEQRKNPEDKKKDEFRNTGEFLQAVRWNRNDQRLVYQDQEDRAMNMGIGGAGGFLVPTQTRAGLLQVDPQSAIFRPRATVIPAGSPPDASISMAALNQTGALGVYSGVTVNWIAEGAPKPETEGSLLEVTLEPHEVAAHTVITDKLLRNSAAAGSLIETLLRRAIIAAEDVAFLRGTGAGQPLGLLGHPSAITINRTGANTIIYADIVAMYARMLFGGPLVWIASQTTLPQLMTMVDAGNNLIWQPNAREGAPGTLLGIPVVYNQRSPILGTQGDLILADLNYYMVKDGSGIFVEASPHPLFVQNRTIIKAFWNVDGSPWLTGPMLLEDGVSTVSPFVVLN